MGTGGWGWWLVMGTGGGAVVSHGYWRLGAVVSHGYWRLVVGSMQCFSAVDVDASSYKVG